MKMEIIGEFNCARVYAKEVEEGAIEQIKRLCDMEAYADSSIAIMPDVHMGKGCTIGTTMTLSDKVTPNLVGVDIGCGMYVIRIQEKYIDFAKLDNLIREKIPSGMNIRESVHPFIERVKLDDLHCHCRIKMNYIRHSLGSLGGGNHFIELDKDEEDEVYLVIHSGSRYLGTTLASLYQEEAITNLKGNGYKAQQKLIKSLREQGRENETQKELAKLKNAKCPVDEDLAYCEGKLFEEYIHDMGIAQEFAKANREAIAEEIISGMGWTVIETFHTVHNYIDIENMILRKGAISAQKGERVIIPINMRDGSLICIGKGNPDYNFSAPHGAGRKFSRKEAKASLDIEEFKTQMEGIYSTCVNEFTIDESPMAYKGMEDILSCLEPTAMVKTRIRPIYNFKAGEEIPHWRKQK